MNQGLENLQASALHGIWSINSVEFEGEVVNIPPDYPDCGRSFFIYQEDGTYVEYVYRSNSCQPEILEYSWSLDKGVVTISTFGQQETIVITKSSDSKFSFKGRIDIDEDGELDEVVFNCHRYIPTERDIYSRFFRIDFDQNSTQNIHLKWEPYTGFNKFVRYEIYRADNFDHNNSELIATYTDPEITELIEENPPVTDRLCYKLRIYTDKGLVGESNADCIFTNELAVLPVQIAEPIINTEEISLNWEASENPYFDHYLITTSNFTPGYSGTRFQEQEVAKIYDITSTSFTDNNPPYFKDPWYNIHVVNIYGKRSQNYRYESSGSFKTTYSRPEILPFQQLYAVAADPDERAVYLYGIFDRYTTAVLIKYDYVANQVVGAPVPLSITTGFRGVKLVSSGHGKEVYFIDSSEVLVYDAETMAYKYALDPPGMFIDDVVYTKDEILMVIDDDEIFTFTRNNSALTPVDSQTIYGNFTTSIPHSLLELQDNKVLIGNRESSQSVVFEWDNTGNLINKTLHGVRVFPDIYQKPIFNDVKREILVPGDKVLISSENLSNNDYFSSPKFPTGLSLDGNTVFGSNNDPEWPPQTESSHLKQAVFYHRDLGTSDQIDTKGYPLLLFENGFGEVFSISSGLKMERISTYTSDHSFFFEKIN